MGSKHPWTKTVSLFLSRAGRKVKTLLFLLFVLFISTTSFAQQFTAKSLGDYGNVTVMEIQGNYDANNTDGTINAAPRQAIAQEFFKTHKDEYDFLVIFTNFDFTMPEGEAKAFYEGIKNDIRGIGVDPFDNTSLYGSNGKLQGTVDMGNLSGIITDPLDPKFEDTLYVLSHELMHSWAAHVKFKDADGSVSSALLGQDEAHWSYLLDSGGSVLYGNQWQDNKNNTFTSTIPQNQMLFYSQLDLYLMGMIGPDKVLPVLLITSPDTDPTQLPQAGVTVNGAARYVTIDQIIAAMGPRIPDAATSQKSFKTAFIFATQPGTFTGQELYGIENIRSGQVTRFSVLTNGKGIVEVASTPKDNIPTNPGVIILPTTPRTIPPNINDGVQWLAANQKSDGSWADLNQTTERDTASATVLLKSFTATQAAYQGGLQWLGGISSGNMDFLSRKIQTFAGSGTDLTALTNELLSRQNPDGGWGSDRSYPSNPVDTALAIKALSAAGYSGEQAVSPAIGYLKNVQNTDNGWGSQDKGSTVQETSNVLSAFNQYRGAYLLDDAITRGTGLLVSKQNSDGGFGNSPSTIYDSATAAMTLAELNASGNIISQAVSYILNQQSGDGSWNQSAYQTALAVEAVYKATVDPDLSLKPGDISFIPTSVTSLPTNVVINANIWNMGATAVPEAKVVIYDGNAATGTKIGEQTLAFPGQAATTVTFSTVINDGNEHFYTIVVDPDSLIKESNKLNNTVVKALIPEPTYDFEVLSSNLTVSANPADMFQDVTITAQITNKGTMNAYNVQVHYYIDDPVSPFEIATRTADIPAGATITNTTIWRTNKAGVSMPLTVTIDPLNNFTEQSKTNNKASAAITVNADTRANLSSSYKNIVLSPSPANQGGNASLSTVVKNEGSSPASNVQVNFYEGVPGVDGVLLGSQVIPIINPGDGIQSSIPWTNITDSGEKIIYVKVDPDNQINEITKDDNDAFTTVNILSLPDFAVSANSLAFLPVAPKDGDPVAITVTVQNKGEQGASNVIVRLSEGGVVLGNQAISSLAGNSTGTVSLSYDTTGKKGAHIITAAVDPDNMIPEQSKGNNSATNTFGVQDANFWVTEPYFSPNGDGAKDSTQFFFRLTNPQTISVLVVNAENETVRTFTGQEPINAVSGSITWDGRNDSGSVVDDGQYQFQVKSSAGFILNMLPVIVDNNRSPLTEALGTKYLVNYNLTCQLPAIDWNWLQNDSGIVFAIAATNPNKTEYPAGVYAMAPDGQGILRLIPADWTDTNSEHQYFDYQQFPAPIGDRIAFTFKKYDTKTIARTTEIWLVNSIGANLTFLDSEQGWNDIELLWSPDGRYLAYSNGPTDFQGVSLTNYELWVLNVNSLEKKKLDAATLIGTYYYDDTIHWSPDSNSLVYTACLDCYQLGMLDCHHMEEIRTADVSGNKRTLSSVKAANSNSMIQRLQWLSDNKVLSEGADDYSGDVKLRLLDSNKSGQPVFVTNNFDPSSEEYSVSPDGKEIAFTDSGAGDNSKYLKMSDSEGRISTIREVHNSDNGYCYPEIENLLWSAAADKLYFSEGVIDSCGGCQLPCRHLYSNEAAFDLATGTTATFDLDVNSGDPIKWLADGVTLVERGNSSSNSGELFAMNLRKRQKTTIISGIQTLQPDANIVSPREGSIAYYQFIDPTSACYNGDPWETKLWDMTSLLNLNARLNIMRQESSLVLKGTATDLNFDGYELEYADVKNPLSWQPVVPPSQVPVVNDVFTPWIPPSEGKFLVRLTVRDKAGNSASDEKQVSWGIAAKVAGFFKTLDVFSPNGDGAKDRVEVHYRVLDPVHLEFNITNDRDLIVKTISVDNAIAEEAFISWDGTDDNGTVVPDGLYKINILDMAFPVTVDNRPPDAGISIGTLNSQPGPQYELHIDINGHAVDSNLKNWVVEYGEGDNPQSWQLVSSGGFETGKQDATGHLLRPGQDTVLMRYQGTGIGQMKMRKLRISAEDSAGNKSSAISGFVEEDFVLYQWDDAVLRPGASIPPSLTAPGVHTLAGFETFRSPLVSMNVQYWGADLQWHDAPAVVDVPQGQIKLEWDTTRLSLNLRAVRLKAIDALGQTHYSNPAVAGPVFAISLPGECSAALMAANFLSERLTELKFQVQSSQDNRYTAWTDYAIFDPAKGDSIPQEEFSFFPPPFQRGKNYQIRMAGVGASGTSYISSPINFPPGCLLEIKLDVTYPEAECGKLSNAALLTATALPNGGAARISMKNMRYYLETVSGLQLLQHFDGFDASMLQPATIDTSLMSEGSYTVLSVVGFIDMETTAESEVSAEAVLIVDHTLPIVRVSYPSAGLAVCSIKQPYGDDIRSIVPIEGIVSDNDRLPRYQLAYGYGSNSSEWTDARIEGTTTAGTLTAWDVTGLPGGNYSVRLKAVDRAGNASCATTSFSLNSPVDLSKVGTDPQLFSPNGDGAADEATLNYTIDQPATTSVRAFKLVQTVDAAYTLDTAPIRNSLTNSQWDGNDDNGMSAPDGRYGLAVTATDSCGNMTQKWAPVEVDNTPPTVEINYPQPGAPLGNIVEVSGTATDINFQDYVLEQGPADNPDDPSVVWKNISGSTVPVSGGVLGTWNTSGLTGLWALRLTATDRAGNKNKTTTILTLTVRTNLIKSLSASPTPFSPNKDGRLDTTRFQYELAESCDVMIEILTAEDVTKKIITATAVPAGVQSFEWNGTDDAGAILPDGAYKVKLAVISTTNAERQVESVTLSLDTLPPVVDVRQPVDGAYVRSDIVVLGSITDSTLADYSVSLTGPEGAAQLDQGTQARSNYPFAILNGLADGAYTLNVKARDLGENAAEKNIFFIVDKTAPVVTLNIPTTGGYYGGENPVVNITGNIVENNIGAFSLRYAADDNSTQWTELASGTSSTAPGLTYSWKVGPDDGIRDGVYTVSLLVTDKAGAVSEAKVKLIIDNTPPVAAIASLHDGDYLTHPVDLVGTSFDDNLDSYKVEISEGQCSNAFAWADIKRAAASVQNGVLAAWQTLPPDGDYCVRLTAIDKAGLSSEEEIDIKVDTHPPASPLLASDISDRSSAHLVWVATPDADVAGYNVYRNNQKVNSALVTSMLYTDHNRTEGTYTYTVTAVDFAGWESRPSNEIKVKIDMTGPSALIRTPLDNARISGLSDIKGTAYSSDDFKQYRLSIGQGTAPSSWTIIRTSPVPVSYGVLSPWNTLGLADEQVYSIKLEAEDLSGNITAHQISVTIDNTPTMAPLLVSASAIVSDVTVTWQANTDTDLAGYLLFRNDQLANAIGIVAGDLQPYLIKGTSYIDRNLPDGKSQYYLLAMDQAGNLSDQSNTLSVTIDTHPPHAAIVDPLDHAQFEQKSIVKAEAPDRDIAFAQFQYQSALDSAWTDLGTPVTSNGMAAYLDPAALGLTYGDYRLRVVATDKGGKTDPAPGFITITYTDLTPPAAPVKLNSPVSGGTANLSWTANTEGDLDGYNIYRVTTGSTRQKINASLIKAGPEPSYQDGSLADGEYLYEVTAVDTYKNESKPSDRADAKIYAPVLAQPYTPVDQSMLQVKGSNGAVNGEAALFAETASGPVSFGTTSIDSSGAFTINAALSPGENRISARITDSAGNVSKDADGVVVVSNDTPSAPAGLIGDVSGYDVHLTWDANPEADIVGYNFFRDGIKINTPDPTSYILASGLSQGNPYFYSPTSPQTGASLVDPVWWEMDMASPELISRVEIQWGTDVDSSGNEVLYAGKDYEIQVWSGYAWITQVKVAGNAVKDNVFHFKPSYRTDKIRISITDSTDTTSAKEVRFGYANVIRDNLIPQAFFDDLYLTDKVYTYAVTAVDNYGFESALSSTVSVTVGDVVAPSVPVLSAALLNADVALTWTASTDADTALYTLYRNDGPGWSRIGLLSAPETAYLDANVRNGGYAYRVTATDTTGNESAPSNEVAVILSVALPDKPANLAVMPGPNGVLQQSWTYTGSQTAGFNLYRGLTAGGPYTRVNGSLIPGMSYVNNGLISGTTYYYVVTAVDSAGNEGGYSNEASGVSIDLVAPSKPVIFFPTFAGMPVTVDDDKTDVSGSAEPGTLVTLSANGRPVASTAALLNDAVQGFPADFDWGAAALSSDGKTLAYSSSDGANESIHLKSLANGTETKIIPVPAGSVNSISWSPDNKKIAYHYGYYDSSNWVYRTVIYDVASDSSTPLLDDPTAKCFNPSWSPDGEKVLYVQMIGNFRDIWIKDLESGTLSQLIAGGWTNYPKLSPDGTMLAYFDGDTLNLYDMANGSTHIIDEATDGYELAWSPDGKKLAFVSFRNGDGDVYVLDIETDNQLLVPGSHYYPYNVAWTADSNRLLFDLWDDANSKDTLWLADVQTPVPAVPFMTDLSNVGYIGGAKAGQIAVLDLNVQEEWTAFLVKPAGNFSFDAMPLVSGANVFTAMAVDTGENKSESSNAITVVFVKTTPNLPDLSVSSDDVYLYPPYPIAGQQMAVNAVVTNVSPVDATNVDVSVYIWNALGQLELLRSETISSLPAGSSSLITATWDSIGKIGSNRLVVVVDPSDKITEADEANNMAIKDFYVADHMGISLNTTADAAQYSSNQSANISVAIWNTGPATDAALTVRIEDTNGYQLTSFATRTISIAYAAQSAQNFAWNTGSTYAGAYMVHAVLKDASGNKVAENTAPFTIVSDSAVDLTVSTGKAAYGPGENVVTGFNIKNRGTNSIIPTLQAAVTIANAAGAVLFSEVKTASNLLPRSSVDLSSSWNTGLNVPGSYTATVEVSFDGGMTSTKSATFTINGLAVLTGSIIASPSVVPVKSAAQVTYTLANSGNMDALGYTARILIIDPETQMVMQTRDTIADVVKNTSQGGQIIVGTSNYELKTYRAILQVAAQGTTKTLGSASFAVKDLTPPAITMADPVANGIYSSTVPISILANDDASGVDRVEYRIDNGIWKLVPIADPSLGRYAALWEPMSGDNGIHEIGFRAVDKAGNVGVPISISLTVQMDTIPPQLTLSTLSDGAFTNNPTLNIAGTATDNVGVQTLTINGAAITVNADGSFSQAISLATGTNTITAIAVDRAGNTATDTRNIILDQAVPMITISSPVDNSVTNAVDTAVTGIVDKESTISINVNDMSAGPDLVTDSSFSFPVSLAYGKNTIQVAATDLAGNTGTAKRTVIFDDVNPVLAVTNPAQDITTNQPGILLQGTAADFTGISVTVTFDNVVSAPAVTSGAFEQQLTFTEEKTYAVMVIATDDAGNQTAVQRNIIFDKTPPLVAINPAITPTNNSIQMLIGTREPDSTVTVTCPTAMASAVSYPTTTTWQAVVADMAEGSNMVSVIAMDLAGNVSDPVTAVIALDTIAPDTIVISTPPALGNSNSAVFSFTSTEDGSTFECKLDQGSYAACTSPLTYANLPDNAHTFLVRGTDGAGNTDQTPASFIWTVDTIPPVAVVSGAPANPTKTTGAVLRVSGDDVLTYKYKVDSGAYSAETAVAAPIVIEGLLDGSHTVSVVGKDSIGNWQTDVFATIVGWSVDTQPPVLTLSALANNAYTNNPTLNIAGTAADNTAVQSVTINNADIVVNADGAFSHVITLATGTNTLTTIAFDTAGNTAIDMRTIILDQTAPAITITGPMDNSVTNDMMTVVTGTVDKPAKVVIAVNNNAPVPATMTGTAFSSEVALAYGLNTIRVSATDRAGNTGSAKRTLIFDNASPTLSVTNPAQDIATNLSSLLLSGIVADLTGITVTVACDGTTYTPAVTDGAFRQQIDFTTEKTYIIAVTAADSAGNITTILRNVVYEITPPVVTINALTTPTNNSQQLIGGTMDLGSTVTMNCPTAIAGTVSYPTATTWQAVLADMQEGTNVVTVTATDEAGNESSPVTVSLVLDIHAPITAASPAAGTYNIAVMASLTTNEPATTYYTADGTAPSSASPVYAGPIMINASTMVKFFSVDPAGNRETEKSAVYTINSDITPPFTNMTVSSPNYTAPGGTLYVTGATVFTLSATDAQSGVARTEYRIDNNAWIAYSAPFAVVGVGNRTIGYRSIDNRNNIETGKTRVVVIDNTPPVSTLSADGSGCHEDGKSTLDVTTKISITASDTESGLQTTTYSIDGGSWIAYSGPFTLAGYSDGMHTVSYLSTDNVGNIEGVKNTIVKISRKKTSLIYTGAVFLPQGRAAILTAMLKVDGMKSPKGELISFTLGNGPSIQSCTGMTDARGNAGCAINPVTMPLGPVALKIVFNGDEIYAPTTNNKNATVFAYPSVGSFVIADRDAVVNRSVTFWGARWAKNNSLSNGTAQTSFKGFADSLDTPPDCGGAWTSGPGNSPMPPRSIPTYMAVVVSDDIANSRQMFRGNIQEIVIVKTNSGYGPDPGHSGIGTMIGVLCQQEKQEDEER